MKNIQCRSVLTKSKLPEVDYCINPYIGCLHRCAYCYATFMRRFTGHTQDRWGEFLDIKENAAEVLRNELKRKKNKGLVLIGSVTDAYQPVEKKYAITRVCLEVLLEFDMPISILTKSDLVLRDVDILSKFSDCEVGLTVEFSQDDDAKKFEPCASSISKRISALDQLKHQGIRNYAFIGPLLPGISNFEEIINKVSGKVDYVMVESLNMRCGNRESVLSVIKKDYPHLLLAYQKGFSKKYWEDAKRQVEETCRKHGVSLKGYYNH